MLIELFMSNSEILIQKLINYVQSDKSSFMEKLVIETIIGKALRSKNTIVETMILVKLVKADRVFQPIVEQTLAKIYRTESENYDYDALIVFADVASLVSVNWPTTYKDGEQENGWDWEKFLAVEGASEDDFKKRKVLAKLIFQKLTLLNDRFKMPSSLSAYSPPDDPKNPTKYKTVHDLEVYESFGEMLKSKVDSEQIIERISNESDYEIFLEALFQRTSLSHTHLQILMARYEGVFDKNKKEHDWTLVTKIRTFWRKSLFHRLLYLCFVIESNYLDFGSYVKYISKVQTDSTEEQLWIKLELNELNKKFGGRLGAAK